MQYRYTEPLDMPRGTHYGNNYWIKQSVKLGRRVTAFSNLEHYNQLRLELDPSVKYYCEQPCRASIKTDAGKDKDVVFDVYVAYKDGREEMQEVKPASDLTGSSESAVRAQLQIAAEKIWCSSNRIDFRVMTEADIIPSSYTAANNEFLYQRLKYSYDIKDYALQLLEYLKGSTFIHTVDEIIEGFSTDVNVCWTSLAWLYANGKAALPVDKEYLTGKSKVTI